MINRERKVDIKELSPEQFEQLEVQLGGKVREICDEAVAKANKLLNIYGLSAQMQIVLEMAQTKKKASGKK